MLWRHCCFFFSLVSIVTLKSKPKSKSFNATLDLGGTSGIQIKPLLLSGFETLPKNWMFLSQQNSSLTIMCRSYISHSFNLWIDTVFLLQVLLPSLILTLLPCFALLAGGGGNICTVLGQIMKHFPYSSGVESVYVMVDKNPGKQMKKNPKTAKEKKRRKIFWYSSGKKPTKQERRF